MTEAKKKKQDDTRLNLTSHDVVGERIEQLKALLPEIFVEGQLDSERLRQHLGDFSKVGVERYGLNWAGKAEAIRSLQIPSHGTLVPLKDQSVKFDESENMIIEGDNLEVLKLLQKSYHGKIKMIYIDPPYNTGGDFIYPDNFKEGLDTYLRYSGQTTESGFKVSTNSENGGRYHSNWLNMMYPRLFMAKTLLKNDGAIFVSIDDTEVANLRLMMNEVFGEENFVGVFIWNAGRKNDSKQISVSHEYVVVYTKSLSYLNENNILWREQKNGVDRIVATYKKLAKQYPGDWAKVSQELQAWYKALKADDPALENKHYRCADERGVYFPSDLSGPDDGRKSRPRYEVLHPVTKKPVPVPARGWRWEKPRILDEPQNMESEIAREAIASLNPLCTLRYSATHRNPYNVIYRLGPVKAYDLGLVKRIEVDSVLEDPNFNKPFIQVQSVQNASKSKIVAKLTVDVEGRAGPQRKTIKVEKRGDDLHHLTKRDSYKGYIVEEKRAYYPLGSRLNSFSATARCARAGITRTYSRFAR